MSLQRPSTSEQLIPNGHGHVEPMWDGMRFVFVTR